MGLFHIPRVALACARGLAQRRRSLAPPAAASPSSPPPPPPLPVAGIGPDHPHLYHGTAGILDVDYLGHLNNAAYLVHAELARWEMAASNGSLGRMWEDRDRGTAFLVAGTTVRYRREVEAFRRFRIDTHVGAVDGRNLWVYHAFRYPGSGSGSSSGAGSGSKSGSAPDAGGRVLAQVLVQAVVVRDRKVLDPAAYLTDVVGADPDLVGRLAEIGRAGGDIDDHLGDDALMGEKRARYLDLEEALRASAAADDEGR